VWIGNATNELVIDGRSGEYASARTTLWLFKNWMGTYHSYLLEEDRIEELGDFEELQPENVELTEFNTPATDRHLAGGCDQMVEAWVRKDVEYEDPCEPGIIDTRNGLLASSQTPHRFREAQRFVKLPGWEDELAIKLVAEPPEDLDVFIPLMPEENSTGLQAVDISFPFGDAAVGPGTEVVGSVQAGRLTEWLLEIAPGSNPGEDDWIVLASGEENMANELLGRIAAEDEEFPPRVYTLRLTARQGLLAPLRDTILVNLDDVPPARSPLRPTSGPTQPIFDDDPPEPVEPEEPEEP